jgi:carbamoyltransferase
MILLGVTILGLNLSHDSSLSIHDDSGKVLFAAQEERFTRQKQYAGFPFMAIVRAFEDGKFQNIKNIEKVVIGSHASPNNAPNFFWANKFFPSSITTWVNNPNDSYLVPPGDLNRVTELALKFSEPSDFIHYALSELLEKVGLTFKQLIFVGHEDSHSASGILGSNFSKCLGFSLDGSGDNESGVVQIFQNGNIRDLARIPETQSLGHLYSAVTKKYGFKPNQHEGKITGLSAFGSHSFGLDYLLKCVNVIDGVPKITLSRGQINKLKSCLLKLLRTNKDDMPATSIENLIDIASSLTFHYPDLAFAIQNVLEETILEIVLYWVKRTGIRDISLAGGVFANVKVNQRIAEHTEVEKVFVFPNMGDGGLSVGGVWRHLHDSKSLKNSELFENMYLGTPFEAISFKDIPSHIAYKSFGNEKVLFEHVSNLLIGGSSIAICLDRMEFGPRALCNRSILVNPFNSKINETLNKKLRRTEFMPFAPVVLDRYAEVVFDLQNFSTLAPFEYMTMTCKVREEWRDRIPAAVHIDGTARPQILKRETNPFVYELLHQFFSKTGVPVLINTSFNAHEEPIVADFDHALDSLNQGCVDYILTRDLLLARNAGASL